VGQPQLRHRCLQALMVFSSRPSWIAPYTCSPSTTTTTSAVEMTTMMVAARSEAMNITEDSVLPTYTEARHEALRLAHVQSTTARYPATSVKLDLPHGAAPKSNRASVGLRHLTGFEAARIQAHSRTGAGFRPRSDPLRYSRLRSGRYEMGYGVSGGLAVSDHFGEDELAGRRVLQALALRL
jgi:hypothetical protein